MPGASNYPALDALYRDEGGICGRLAEWQEQGLSYTKMADRILAEKGYSASPSALQRYVTGACDE